MKEKIVLPIRILQKDELEKKGLRIRVFPYLQNNTVMHGHAFAEIAVIISGKGMHRTFKGLEPLLPGDVLLVPEGAVHAYEEVDNLRLVNILFPPEELPVLSELNRLQGCGSLFAIRSSQIFANMKIMHLNLKPDDFSFVKDLLALMMKESSSALPGERCAVLGAFLLLVSRIVRGGGGYPLGAEKKIPDGITRAINYILDNYEKEIELKDLVKISKMSSSSFMRVFSAVKGTSPMNFLAEVRINRACTLLQSHKCGITEVAGKVGFVDSNYFSRAFHKHIGISPREFRRASAQSVL